MREYIFIGALIGDWLQALCTLATGGLAIYAAKIAFRAATRETERHEAERIQKTLAFKIAVRVEIRHVRSEAQGTIAFMNRTLDNYQIKILPTISALEFLSEKHWENHSLLNEDIIKKIYLIRRAVELINRIPERFEQSYKNDLFVKDENITYEQYIKDILNRINLMGKSIEDNLGIDMDGAV